MEIIYFLILIVLCIFVYLWLELRSTLRIKKCNHNQFLKNQKIIKKILKTSDGLKISSWYIPVKNPKAVIILIHGHKQMEEGKNRLLPHAKFLNKAGYSTALIDLRAFGESEGNKTHLGTNEWKDVEAAYDYIKFLPENKNKKIGLYGKSMGGVIAIITKAITKKGDFVISLTPYASFKSLFRFKIKKKIIFPSIFLPLLRLAGIIELGINYEKYSSINLIQKIKVPIFIAEAKHDDIVDKNDAKLLFDDANEPKMFWLAPTNHDDIYRKNPKEFQSKILAFLSKI